MSSGALIVWVIAMVTLVILAFQVVEFIRRDL